MLQSRSVKRLYNWILALSVSIVFGVGSGSKAEAFSTSSLHLGSQPEFILAVKSALSTETLAVFDQVTLEQVSRTLSDQLGIRILVDSKVASRAVEVVGDNLSFAEVLRRIAANTETYLVYRDGCLLFTDSATFGLQLTAQISPELLTQLSTALAGTKIEVRVKDKKLDATASRREFLRLRDVLLSAGVNATIQQTDLVVDQFEQL